MDDFSLGDSFGNDFGGGYDLGGGGGGFGWSPSDTMLPGSQYGGGAGGGWLQGLLGGLGGSQGGLGGGGGMGGLMQLLGLGLGGGGALASLLGAGNKQTATPKMTGNQIDAMNMYRGAIGQQLPQQQAMFNQGAGMLNNLQQGQIPQGLTNTVAAAYNPYMQNLGQSAIEASQRAGFALPQDAMTGGPGLRIMGQGMAQLPGQMAQTTLNTMFPLISQLMGQGQQGITNTGNAFGALPGGQTQQNDPGMMDRLTGASKFAAGIGNIFNPPQYNLMMMNPITGMGQNNQNQRIKVAGEE